MNQTQNKKNNVTRRGAGKLKSGRGKPITVNTAVLADAGFSIRFLPTTKVVPKSLLPVGDLPCLMWILKELKEAGITRVIHVVSDRSLETIKAFYAEDPKLTDWLEKTNKWERIAKFYDILAGLHIELIIQDKRLKYGTGAPLLSAAELVGDSPFVYAYTDDLTFGRGGVTKILVDTYIKYNARFSDLYAVLAVQPVEWDQVHKYGVVRTTEQITPTVHKMDYVVEKPSRQQAPSNLVSYGRFLFTRHIFDALQYNKDQLDSLPEYFIQPAITKLAEQGTVLSVFDKDITWYTTGDPLNMYKAWQGWYKHFVKKD